MRLRCRFAVLGVLAWCAQSASAGAQDASESVVWYRASEECPTGSAFLGKIAGNTARARLADAGDHIDFVVTLVTGSGGSVGRLERQTQGGIVAIRELRDVSCERVADALALSLGLALDPAPAVTQPTPIDTSKPTATSTGPADSVATPAAGSIASSAPTGTETKPAVGLPTARLQRAASPTRSVTEVRGAGAPSLGTAGWSAGLDVGALLGASPSPLLRGEAFLEIDRAVSGFASDASVRLGVVGALGSSTTEVGPVQQWILAGRAEVCPWRWGGARVGLRPCGAFELGATGAAETSSSRQSRERASSIWAAPGIGLRGGAALLPELGLEAGAGVLLPLVRSEVDAGSDRLYRAKFTALSGYLGVFFGPF